MLGIAIKKRQDTYFIEGNIDELADFDQILNATDRPLRLNWREVKRVNSQGIAVLIKFGQALGDRQVEMYELSPALVEAVNFVPLVVGGQSRIDRIKSVHAPFACEFGHYTALTVPIADLDVQRGAVALPALSCEECGGPLHLSDLGEPADFFFFLLVTS